MSDNSTNLGPHSPDDRALALAREILNARCEFDHRDMNAMIAAARAAGIPYELTYFGPNSADAKSVICAVADMNLRHAPTWRIERRISTLNGKIGASIAHTISRFDPNTLGGRGAAGRVRDRARAAGVREMYAGEIARLRLELVRRNSQI